MRGGKGVRECLGTTTATAATAAAAAITTANILQYFVDLSENYWSDQNLRFKWALNMYHKTDRPCIFVYWLLYARASYVQCVLANVSMCLFVCVYSFFTPQPAPLVCFNSGTCYSTWLDIACISTILLNLQSLIPRVIIQSGIWCFDFFFISYPLAACRTLHFFIICHTFVCVCEFLPIQFLHLIVAVILVA